MLHEHTLFISYFFMSRRAIHTLRHADADDTALLLFSLATPLYAAMMPPPRHVIYA